MSVIYTQGGAASVADATTTTSGKVRLATIAEAGGTSEAIAVTPAGLQAEISSLANGLIYRGAIDVADFGTALASASLGDYYKISTGGTSGGVVYSVGDSIIVNADMGGTFSDAKLDRIDNVDPSTSDEITGNHNATNYTATNSDTLTTHLSGLDAKLGTLATVATSGAYADLSGTPTLATVATSGDYADLANKPSADDLNADHATPSNYTAADVNIDDHLIGIDNALGLLAPLASPTFSGVPEAPTATAGTNTQQIATTAFVSAAVTAAGGLSNIVEDTSPQLGNPLDVNGHAITSASNGDVTLDPDGTGDIAIGADLIPDADGTHTIGSEDARYVSTYSDLNGAIRFKAQNDEGAQIVKGQPVYIKGLAGNGTTPTVGLADADDATKMPAFGIAQNTANNGAEIQIIQVGNLTDIDTSGYNVGDTLYIDTTAGGLVATPPATESAKLQNIGRVIRKDNASGVIMVGGAGRSAATPNLNDGKIFLGDSNNRSVPTALSSIALSSFNDDLSYQPLDPALTSIAGLTTSGDEIIYTDGADSYTTASITAAGRALLDDADAAAQRTTLGLATVASSGAYSDLSGTPSADDLLADHTAVNYTAANANIDGHLAGIDSALASVGSTNPNIYATTSSSYSPSASDAPKLNVWYGASSTGNFTLTLPSILSVLTGTGATGSVVETFEMWVGRAVDGDIVINATDGIDGIGGASNTNVTTLTVSAGQWIKIVGWKSSSTNGKYLIGDPQSSGLSNIVEDTSPQLGGNLDPNGNAISGALVPATANAHALGSADAEWSDLFLGDGAFINFGNDQDIKLSHVADQGLVLEKDPGGAFYPRFTIRNHDSGSLSYGELQFDSQSTTPANNDFISRILARGQNSAAQGFDYSKIVTRIGDVTDGTEAGRILFQVGTGGTVAGNTGTTALELYGDNTGEMTVKIAEHDGASSGLMLGSTLVTSTAAELNLLDGGSTVGASITIADTDGFFVNDGGVSKLIPALDLKTYAGGGGGGGTSYTYSAISATTSAQAWYHYSVNTSGGAVTLNLPALASVTDGDEIRVKLRVAGNDLTIDANSTETIDGSQTQTLSVATSSITLVAGSTEWEIV